MMIIKCFEISIPYAMKKNNDSHYLTFTERREPFWFILSLPQQDFFPFALEFFPEVIYTAEQSCNIKHFGSPLAFFVVVNKGL